MKTPFRVPRAEASNLTPMSVPYVKKPDYEVLLQLLNNRHANEQRFVRIAYPEAVENTCNTEENTGQMSTGVEFLLQMSHNGLAFSKEHI